MNKQISQIITVVLNNRIVCVDSNTTAVHACLKAKEPSFWEYAKLQRLLKISNYLTFEVSHKIYYIEIKRYK